MLSLNGSSSLGDVGAKIKHPPVLDAGTAIVLLAAEIDEVGVKT